MEIGADVIVVQGTDAGGHGWERGAGLITLLPEIVDLLKSRGMEGKVPLIAAGGIMDGRGVVAAFALGEFVIHFEHIEATLLMRYRSTWCLHGNEGSSFLLLVINVSLLT